MEISRLRELLDYDAITGVVRWRVRPASDFATQGMADGWNNRFAGAVVGSLNKVNGYLNFKILDGREKPFRCGLHRVCWGLYHGNWPEGDIDHENHCRSDNRIKNLTDSTPQKNSKNRALSSKNTTGRTGVVICKDRKTDPYRAQITHEGRGKNLGNFATLEAAAAARKAAEVRLGFHPNHGKG